MLIHVYGQEKPALRRRTIAASVALLAITIGLAASLTRESKGTRLAPTIIPAGWSVSVRPPPGARKRQLKSGRGFLLDFPTESGAVGRLIVLRLDYPDHVDLQTAAEDVFASPRNRRPHAVGGLPLVWHDKTLGAHEAVEVWDPDAGGGYVVRVGRVNGGGLYAVAFDPAQNPPDTYEAFESFCRSFKDLSR